jgi:hypothetical protein
MRNDSDNELDHPDIQSRLDARFGVTMTTQEVARTLKMSVAALRMARSRKQLPFGPIPIDGRRHQIYCTADVGKFLLARIAQSKEAVHSTGQLQSHGTACSIG